MKICFSTLGCPDWSWKDIISTAKDFGYDGLEIRGISNEMYVPRIKEFSTPYIHQTLDTLERLGLEIPCLTSACYIYNRDDLDKNIEDAKQYIDKAQELNVPYVRVLGDKAPEPGKDIDVNVVRESLMKLGKYAGDKNVVVLIETNGVFSDSAILKKLLDDVNSKNVGVIWDIHHPYRFMNESVEQTYNNLKDYIKHIHIKDSIKENGRIKYKMLGQGDIPIKESLTLLKQGNFKGFISLEWVKRWYRDLEEPGVVFMETENYIKDLLDKI